MRELQFVRKKAHRKGLRVEFARDVDEAGEDVVDVGNNDVNVIGAQEICSH